MASSSIGLLGGVGFLLCSELIEGYLSAFQVLDLNSDFAVTRNFADIVKNSSQLKIDKPKSIFFLA